MILDEGKGLSTEEQQYDPMPIIGSLRRRVDEWRLIPDPANWQVTPETARLLQHWRTHQFSGLRPFFCQIEAMETLIWLTEVAPKRGREGRVFLDHLAGANEQANPGLGAAGAQAGHRRGQDHRDGDADRLADRQRRSPSQQPELYVRVPGRDTGQSPFATGYEYCRPTIPTAITRAASWFPQTCCRTCTKPRSSLPTSTPSNGGKSSRVSKGGRSLLQGRTGPEVQTLETEGRMLQRVMRGLLGMRGILAINDEAHHCYRQRSTSKPTRKAGSSGDDLSEAKQNREAARLWISGLEAVQRKLGLRRVVDLSATPVLSCEAPATRKARSSLGQ